MPRWRRVRERSRWYGVPTHSALLVLVGTGLVFNPPNTSPVPEPSPRVAAPFVELPERPRVALEPFGLWWGLMGSPATVWLPLAVDSAVDEPIVEPELVAEKLPASLSKPVVPFRTQLDGSRFASSNCGPATLGMVLQAFGINKPTDELRYRTHTYQGTWGSHTGTALQHIARVAEDLGVPTRGLYASGRFRAWTIHDLREEVRQGHPVMILVKYRLLPGHEGARAADDHYIVLWDLDGDSFVYNDSIMRSPATGYARRISPSRLEQATQASIIPFQAVAFLPQME